MRGVDVIMVEARDDEMRCRRALLHAASQVCTSFICVDFFIVLIVNCKHVGKIKIAHGKQVNIIQDLKKKNIIQGLVIVLQCESAWLKSDWNLQNVKIISFETSLSIEKCKLYFDHSGL